MGEEEATALKGKPMKIRTMAAILILGILLVSALACGGGGEPAPTPTPTPMVTPTPTPSPTPTESPVPTREVSGVITTDTVWTADHVYIVTGNVGIAEGATLTIEPGTTVRFSPGCKLQVAGTLTAQGTESERITLTSEASGSWGGIEFVSSSINSVIAYAVVEHASSSSYRGVINAGDNPPAVHHNIVRNCGSDGIGVWHPQSGNVIISHNSIENCKGAGIIVWTHSSNVTYSLDHNRVSGCGTGIKIVLCQGVEVHCEYNIITENRLGVAVEPAYTSEVEPQYLHINRNNIYANSEYNLSGRSLGDRYIEQADASDNWWGTTDESLIEKGIHDYSDDLTLPELTYKPYATAPIPGAGP